MTANVVNYAILGQRKLKLNDLVATQAHNMREVRPCRRSRERSLAGPYHG